MSSSVKIRGTKYGITVQLAANASYEEIKEETAVRFKDAEGVFKDARLAITFEGKYLTEAQQEELVDIIHDVCSLRIVCIMERNSRREQQFKQRLDDIQEELDASNGQFYKGTFRSGQSMEFEKSVIILGDINPGAKIISKGNIVVLGSLKGTAIAGASGNRNCFIIAMCMNPSQLQIADIFAYASEQDMTDGKTLAPKIAFSEDENIYIEPLTKSVLNDIKL